jgi:hypothetical protein
LSSVDVVVCLDANFIQKRRKPAQGSGRDPPLAHPASAFLLEDSISSAKHMVETAWAQPASSAARAQQANDDSFEPGMKVSANTLDACMESFTAADEQRTKASTQFFADTGLTALLCRHDQVLYLANMTTPGERQFYALALLIKLFKVLPNNIHVGVLYDIGCQLDRSCRKWDFIPAYRDRIVWGVSVFHAYGHQWPCQLVYHPQKCVGFGLSVGEGCERFWSSIQNLVPSLQVSGVSALCFTNFFELTPSNCQVSPVSFPTGSSSGLHAVSIFDTSGPMDHL